ncbi:conjugal transfer protein MobB [Niabella terrae]
MEPFQRLMQLNHTAKYQVIHISLNFYPRDQPKLHPYFLTHLADEFMFRIGFGDQPYLVYEHRDALHPHIHILSTLILQDGMRLFVDFGQGRDTKRICRDLVQRYQLATDNEPEPGPRQPEGKEAEIVPSAQIGTTQSISRALDQVLDHYRYSNLEELNAVLKRFNVLASRGRENSRMYQYRGLVYFITNEKGERRTLPVKASKLKAKPTLNYIEEKIRQYQQFRAGDRLQLQATLQWTLQRQPRLLSDYAASLKREGIDLLVQRTADGGIAGFTYIDHRHKTVFMDRDLEASYRSACLLERFSDQRDRESDRQINPAQNRRPGLQRVPLPDKAQALTLRGERPDEMQLAAEP